MFVTHFSHVLHRYSLQKSQSLTRTCEGFAVAACSPTTGGCLAAAHGTDPPALPAPGVLGPRVVTSPLQEMPPSHDGTPIMPQTLSQVEKQVISLCFTNVSIESKEMTWRVKCHLICAKRCRNIFHFFPGKVCNNYLINTQDTSELVCYAGDI